MRRRVVPLARCSAPFGKGFIEHLANLRIDIFSRHTAGFAGFVDRLRGAFPCLLNDSLDGGSCDALGDSSDGTGDSFFNLPIKVFPREHYFFCDHPRCRRYGG